MSAIRGTMVPDVVTSSQTWTLSTPGDAERLLAKLLGAVYPDGAWQRHACRGDEWSGAGVYRLRIRLNRTEGKPLYSLKWEGV